MLDLPFLARAPRRPPAASDWTTQIVSARTGLARNVSLVSVPSSDPDVWLVAAEPAKGAPLGARSSRDSCGGAGLSFDAAKRAALGELVEGYCATLFRREHFLVGCFDDLSARCPLVSPDRFALYSDEQYRSPAFPFARFDSSSVVAWVRGHSLVSEQEAYVPASNVYMPYTRTRSEVDIGPIISTGLAAGPNLVAATLSAIYECIERDAFTIFWLNRSRVRVLDLEGSSDSHVLDTFRGRLSKPGHAYSLYEITSDLGVPTVLAVLASDTPNGTVYSIGAACRLDGLKAVEKALIEAVQGKSYVIHLLSQAPGWQPKPDFSDVTSFEMTAKLYSAVPRFADELADIGRRATAVVPLEALPSPRTSPSEQLAALAQIFRARGYELVRVDITTRDVEELGLKVVRVVAPELQKLHAHHLYPFLGGRRVYDVPVRLEQQRKPKLAAEFNPLPHPFP